MQNKSNSPDSQSEKQPQFISALEQVRVVGWTQKMVQATDQLAIEKEKAKNEAINNLQLEEEKKYFILRQSQLQCERPNNLKCVSRKEGETLSWKISESKDLQTTHKWQSFLKSIQQLNISRFQAQEDSLHNILQCIENISFPFLKDLALNGNNISSLESLQNCHFQNVQTIRFDCNKISTLRVLKKCSFPSLTQIDFEDNYIEDFSPIAEMNAPNLMVVRIEDWGKVAPKNDDLRWALKINSNKLNYLRNQNTIIGCPNPFRMKTSTIDAALNVKFPNLNIMRSKSD